MAGTQAANLRAILQNPLLFELISRNTNEADLRDLCIAAHDPQRHLFYRQPLPGRRSWESVHCLRINSARADGLQCWEIPSAFDPALPGGQRPNIGSPTTLMNWDEDEDRFRNFTWPVCDRCRRLADNFPMLVQAKDIPASAYVVTYFPPGPPAAPAAIRRSARLQGLPTGAPAAPPVAALIPTPVAAVATITRRNRDVELCESHWSRLCERHHRQFSARPVPNGRFRGECACGPTLFSGWRCGRNRDRHYVRLEPILAEIAQDTRDGLKPPAEWSFNRFRGRQLRRWKGPAPRVCGQCMKEVAERAYRFGAQDRANRRRRSTRPHGYGLRLDDDDPVSNSDGDANDEMANLSPAGIGFPTGSEASAISDSSMETDESSDAGSSDSWSSEGSVASGLIDIIGQDDQAFERRLAPAGEWTAHANLENHWVHYTPARAEQVKFCLACCELVWL